MVHLRICRPVFQRRFARLIFLVGVAAQMGQHGPIRPGFRPPGVHGKRLAEHLAGGGILLGIDRVVGQQQQGGHVPGVVTQDGLQ